MRHIMHVPVASLLQPTHYELVLFIPLRFEAHHYNNLQNGSGIIMGTFAYSLTLSTTNLPYMMVMVMVVSEGRWSGL